MEKAVQIALLLDIYGGLLTEKQIQYLDLYYNEDYSLTEIARLHQITPQGVKDTIHRARATLFHTEEKLGLLEKLQSISQTAGELDALLMAHKELIPIAFAEKLSSFFAQLQE